MTFLLTLNNENTAFVLLSKQLTNEMYTMSMEITRAESQIKIYLTLKYCSSAISAEKPLLIVQLAL